MHFADCFQQRMFLNNGVVRLQGAVVKAKRLVHREVPIGPHEHSGSAKDDRGTDAAMAGG